MIHEKIQFLKFKTIFDLLSELLSVYKIKQPHRIVFKIIILMKEI